MLHNQGGDDSPLSILKLKVERNGTFLTEEEDNYDAELLRSFYRPSQGLRLSNWFEAKPNDSLLLDLKLKHERELHNLKIIFLKNVLVLLQDESRTKTVQKAH